jgi:caffeyl-CoA reductase-Etf complex subunit CarE
MDNIKVNELRCIGCGKCVSVCPENCIEMKPSDEARVETKGKVSWPKLAVIDKGKCTLCKACVSACRSLYNDSKDKNVFNAIEISVKKAENEDISSYKGVWIFAEIAHDKLAQPTYELLHIGKKIADELGEPLCAVAMGENAESFSGELISHGAKTVYVAQDPALKNFVDDVYSKCLADMVKKYKPNKFILPATTLGRSLAAKVAIIVDTGLTADATELMLDNKSGLLHVTRPTFGGNLMATIVCEHRRPEMCTLRPMSYPKIEEDKSNTGNVEKFPFDAGKYTSKAKFIRFVDEESDELDISAAEVIVSGGRGLGNPDGFKLLRELSDALGGAVGASRAAVDAGWIPYRHQVGLTGRTVKPKLYIACGISGQIQHKAGMSSSDIIVAINKDPDAPLMHSAHYALCGDLYEVIPALIEELKNS